MAKHNTITIDQTVKRGFGKVKVMMTFHVNANHAADISNQRIAIKALTAAVVKNAAYNTYMALAQLTAETVWTCNVEPKIHPEFPEKAFDKNTFTLSSDLCDLVVTCQSPQA